MKYLYSKKVMDHFLHPKNMGRMKNADGMGIAGNPVCGDIMYLYIKVKDNKIVDIKFETLGCPVAIAVSSVLTDLAKGKTLEEALKIDNKDILKVLGDVPPIKMHCSILGDDALHEAIYDYYKKHNKQIPEWLEKKHQQIVKRNKEEHH